MELTWTHDSEDRPERTCPEDRVAGNVWTLGPFLVGSFRYIRREGGGFWFIGVRGTRLSLNGGW